MISLGIKIDNAVHKIDAHGFYFEDGFCVINCIKGESVLDSRMLVLGCVSNDFENKRLKEYTWYYSP